MEGADSCSPSCSADGRGSSSCGPDEAKLQPQGLDIPDELEDAIEEVDESSRELCAIM